jgi:anti-sigma B factor antagonist
VEEMVPMEISKEEGVSIVEFKATSMSSVEGIGAASKQIQDYISEMHPDKIIIDFAKVKFFSSQVLGLLLGIRAKMRSYNAEVLISGINPQLYRVFRITNLDRIFRFFPERGNALKAANES